MTQLIGLSGSHGTGKTTVIDYIKNNVSDIDKLNITIDDFKVSRTILAELGLTLEQATATAELTKDYQSKVLQRKIEYDTGLSKRQSFSITPTSYLIDRSVADIYAYTRLWCEKNNVDGEWFITFQQKCIEAISLYDIIILFPINKFGFVDDGVRAKQDTQDIIAKYIEEFVIAYAKNYHVVESVSVPLRANEILKIIK